MASPGGGAESPRTLDRSTTSLKRRCKPSRTLATECMWSTEVVGMRRTVSRYKTPVAISYEQARARFMPPSDPPTSRATGGRLASKRVTVKLSVSISVKIFSPPTAPCPRRRTSSYVIWLRSGHVLGSPAVLHLSQSKGSLPWTRSVSLQPSAGLARRRPSSS